MHSILRRNLALTALALGGALLWGIIEFIALQGAHRAGRGKRLAK